MTMKKVIEKSGKGEVEEEEEREDLSRETTRPRSLSFFPSNDLHFRSPAFRLVLQVSSSPGDDAGGTKKLTSERGRVSFFPWNVFERWLLRENRIDSSNDVTAFHPPTKRVRLAVDPIHRSKNGRAISREFRRGEKD